MRGAFGKNTRGGVSVEMALLCGVMVLVTGAAVEAGYAYHQHGSAQHAARHGARLASLGIPVADAALDATGTYSVACSGASQSCTQGTFNADALDAVVFGADGDGVCGATKSDRRGMCDVFGGLTPEHIEIAYNRERDDELPLVTVSVRERPLKTVFLGPLLPGRFTTLPRVSATQTGGDLRG